MSGYLYVLSNPSIPNLLRIGYTLRTVEERIKELKTTGVPSLFVLEFYCHTTQAYQLEQRVHKLLANHHHNKEFFSATVEQVVRTIKSCVLKNDITVISWGGNGNATFLTQKEMEVIEKEKQKFIKEELRTRQLLITAEQLQAEKIKMVEEIGLLTLDAMRLAEKAYSKISFWDKHISLNWNLHRQLSAEERQIFVHLRDKLMVLKCRPYLNEALQRIDVGWHDKRPRKYTPSICPGVFHGYYDGTYSAQPHGSKVSTIFKELNLIV